VRRPHLCHIHPSFGTGGPEVRTSLVIDASSDEFRHTVIALDGELGGRSRIRGPADVHFQAAPRTPGRIGGSMSLASTIRDLRPDLVLTYGWGGTDGVLAARLGGLRRLIHAEDGFLPDEADRQRLSRLLARRALLRIPARVVCPSRTLVRIATRTWWLPTPKVRYIPNGVDSGRFRPASPAEVAEARKRIGCAGSDVVVGTVGRLGAEKNHERLVRALAHVSTGRSIRLLIVGDGPSRQRLGRLAGELGLGDRVTFVGQVDDPLDCYWAMDLFALSSDTEQMPIAALEAMGVGLPVVSTDVGDVRSMVGPDNRRYVVPLHRESDYAAALAALIDDTQARAWLGRTNREECLRRYGLDAMIRAYLDLYREVLDVT